MIVPGFRHVPGVHCGSTALADVWRLHGAEMSEAMAFGLGRGAHFFYLRIDGPRPTRALYGRSLSLEYDACRALGASYEEEREPYGGRTWERLRAHLDSGRAPIAACDVGRLPYYGTSGSFNGHRLVVAGEQDGCALVADTHFPDLLSLPVAQLVHAMESDAPPILSMEATWMLVGPPARLPDPAAALKAARETGARFLEDESGFSGASGLRAFIEDLPSWATLPRPEKILRAGYHFIERRGTGGGMFRRLFANFLREAGLLDLGARVEEAAEAWTRLALEMRVQSERTPDLGEVVRLAKVVLEREEAWARAAREARP